MGELPNSPDWTCTSKLYSFHGIQENQKFEFDSTFQNISCQGDFLGSLGVFQGFSVVGMGEIFMSWTVSLVFPLELGVIPLFLGTLL